MERIQKVKNQWLVQAPGRVLRFDTEEAAKAYLGIEEPEPQLLLEFDDDTEIAE